MNGWPLETKARLRTFCLVCATVALLAGCRKDPHLTNHIEILNAERRALEVAVASARREVEKCTIKAPFPGVVTERLGQVEVNALMLVSGTHDSSTPESSIDFTSSTQQRISSQTVPMLEPGHVMKLPRGQAFALMQGGQLYKLRLPLSHSSEIRLPGDLAVIARDMERRYRSVPTGEWASYEQSVDLSRLQSPPTPVGTAT